MWMTRSRCTRLVVGGALALAAVAAAPAVADVAAPPAPNLEVAARWSADTSGKTILVVDVHNAGATAVERPWLQLDSQSIPPGDIQPGCLDVQTVPPPNAVSLVGTGLTRCLLAPLAAEETRQVVVHVPSPALQGAVVASGYSVMATGDDGVRGGVKSSTVLKPPPAITVAAAGNQNPARGFRVRLRATKAGRALVRLAVPEFRKGSGAVSVQRTVTFPAKGTRTVTLRAHGSTLRRLRQALRDGAWKAVLVVEFTPSDRWAPASVVRNPRISRR